MGPLSPADRRAIETDNVVRLRDFRAAHPEVSVTSPRENRTIEWCAVWTDAEETVHEIKHYDLGPLLDALEAAFNRRP